MRAIMLLLAGVLGLPLGARAQPSLASPPGSPPVTTLLRPRDLGQSTPLLPQDGSGPSTVPCARVSVGAATRGGDRAGTTSLAYSGSGPGEYARYFGGSSADAPLANANGAGDAATPGGVPAPGFAQHKRPAATGGTAAAAADRPLYGGESRPLWDTQAQTGSLTGSPADTAAPGGRVAGSANGGTVPAGSAAHSGGGADPDPHSLPLRDRPLWSDGTAPVQGQAAPVSPCLGAAGSPSKAP